MPLSQTQANDLLNDTKYCPVCGYGLEFLGSLDSDIKFCENGHGTMRLVGRNRGVPGMLFERTTP
jgi:hypothetical protein